MSAEPVTEADLQAYVDERLAPERARVVEQWLAERPGESARIMDHRRQRDALRTALDPVIDEPLPAALDLRLRVTGRQTRWRITAWPAIAASLAMLMIGGAGGWTLRSWQSPATVGTAALAREAATSYAVYASDTARPVEIAASQRQQLDRWFSQRLDRPVRAPDLGRAGLTLIGGRLIATDHGPAGLYLYRYADGTRVAVYVRPMEVDGNAQMVHRDERGVTGWTWADDGLGFGVFGGGGSPALHGAADLVRSQYDRI